MRSFIEEPHYTQIIVTFCLIFTNCYCIQEKAEDYPVDQKGDRIKYCVDMKIEDMTKHVYVQGDSSDDIELNCQVKNKTFRWLKYDLKNPKPEIRDYVEVFSSNPLSDLNSPYSASGDSLETYLKIGKPVKDSAGIYCCEFFDWGKLHWFPIVSHAVLILPKGPEINVTFSNKSPVKNSEEISLNCSKPSPYQSLSSYLTPKIFWERNSEKIKDDVPNMEFKVTAGNQRASFRCGWRYENLFNNGSSKTFYSNPFSIIDTLIDDNLSTDNTKLIEVATGDSITLTCVFKDGPPVDQTELCWTKISFTERDSLDNAREIRIDARIDNDAKYSTYVKNQNNFTTYFSLTINQFNKLDTGSYRCKMSNQLEREFKVKVSPDRSSSTGPFISFGFILTSLLLSNARSDFEFGVSFP